MVEMIQKYLKDEIELEYGKGLTSNQRRNGKIPVYGSNGIVDYNDKFYFEGPGIIIGRKGTVGSVKYEENNFWAIDTTYVVKLKNKNEDLIFWYYFLQTLGLERMNSHSAVPGLNRDRVYNIKINIPKKQEDRKRISIILRDLDKKIELNNQINDNLSEQLQLIFNEWFGKYNCNNIPNNWKIKKLKYIAAFSQGVQIPIEKQKDTPEDGYTRFIRIVDVTQKNDKDIRYIEDTERGKVSENEIFMIRYGTPGILSWNYNGIIANNLFKITPKDNTVSSNYLYSFLNAKPFQNYIKGNATSSTMPAINFSTLNDIEVILPDKDSMDRFNEISETIRLKQLSIIEQNKTLSQLRDTLLPKLMNGEIDLNKIKI
ncbi:MAG: restriction endonuclease subunit S [Clostridia bacterium]|jgi:type I restriction-modification system, S subunit, ecoA family protein